MNNRRCVTCGMEYPNHKMSCKNPVSDMKDKEKIQLLSNCFNEVIWMAIRYADGRHTYAPSMVRDAIRDYKKVFPDWKPKHDVTIEPPQEGEVGGLSLQSDYLYDLFDTDNRDTTD